MSVFVANPVLIVVLPVALALLIALLGRRAGLAAPLMALLAPLLTGATAVVALDSIVRSELGSAPTSLWATSQLASPSIQHRWFTAGESMLRIATAIDTLAAVMLLVVAVVAACVVVFSVGYLRGDAGWARYFALIALFTGSMNLLVIATSFTALFIGWELVGASSFLLIGFWYERPAAASAAIKAFVTTRVGDVGLLLGIAILWSATGTDVYEGVVLALGSLPTATVNAAALCLAIGAIGKSAQFPLHGWLPDAMEGPTPVSALIHAATMVAAGVYLTVRLWPLFDSAPTAKTLLLAVGVISAVGAALVATVQRDIKKVLAYSTISQLGFMFAALGVGAWYAAFFHLVAHAAFKALLFLGSGSVIHGSGTQDLHEMGGLRHSMPATFLTWAVGALALAGIVPLAGFFSKDAVLESVWHASPLAGGALFFASVLTGFYVARTTRLAFFGPAGPGHAHESPASMLVPLVILAIPAAGLGAAQGVLAEVLHTHAEPLALAISVAATAAAVAGGIAGWVASAGPVGDAATHARFPRASRLLGAAYGWDALVARLVVAPTRSASRALWAWGDRLIADGIPEGSARATGFLAARISRIQSGDTQLYGAATLVAVVLMLVVSVWLGR